jgi:cell division transport system permease protein
MHRKSLYLPKVLLIISRHLQAISASIRQLSKEPLATIMTFAVIGIALALPMGLHVISKNISAATTGLHDSAQISLYLKKDISANNLKILKHNLHNDASIASFKYISARDGLKEFQKNSGFGNVLQDLNTNPLPDVVVVVPNKSIKTNLQIDQLLFKLKHSPYVADAQLDLMWLKRLNAILSLSDRFIYSLMLFFALAVVLIIGNTIRLTTQNNSAEIAVIKLLGGENKFIRRPFLYAGIIYGLVGAILAWFVVDTTIFFIAGPVSRLANLYASDFTLAGMSAFATLILLGVGIILGYVGSWIAVGKYINDIEPD